jgi:hypothetical protein
MNVIHDLFLSFSLKVTIERKYAEKNYPHQLFGFLTKYVGTSFQLEKFEKKNKKHARLTVHGEEDTFHFHHEKNNVAEQSVLTNYITVFVSINT